MPTRIHITTESLEPSASKWDSTYTTVRSNSADWEAAFGSAGSDLAVRALTANWESTYTTFKDASSTFLTSETDSQTLTFSEGSKELSISNGNTVSLSALVDLNAGDIEVRALTANWESTYTTFKDASSTFLTSETDSQTLSFNEGNKELSISNGNTVSLTALVDLNAGDTEVRALTANWESTYTTVQTNSASWDYQGTDLKDLSANWESTYTTFSNASSTFLTSETDSQTLSFNEGNKELSISNGNTVSLSSLVDLNAGDAEVRALTANWESTYTTVQSNSGIWDYQGTDIKDLSANWESTYTTVQSNSASWDYQGTDIKDLSANWESTYTTYSSNSSEYIKTDTSNSTPGLSAVTLIVAVSALPSVQEPNTLYILI